MTAPDCGCPEGYYDNAAATCPQCDSKCSTCETTAENCIKCASGRNTVPDCVCDDGTYDNNGVCEPCAAQCSTCNSLYDCTECASGREEIPSCTCEDGTYDVGISECALCSTTCYSCSGTSSNCLICAEGLISPPDCVVPPAEASSAQITNVPVGSAKYISCDESCASCEISATNCLTCDDNRAYAPTCACLDGFYEDSDRVCQECSYKCTKCTSDSICTVC